MIKRVKIENFAGIKNYNTSFKLKSIRQNNKTIEEQVIMDGDDAYSLLPTFLAKNASGKTSFIKAIEFVSRFLEKESFINEVTSYAFSGVQREIMNMVNGGNPTIEFSFSDDLEDSFFGNWDKVISTIVKQLFEETSYAGAEYLLIEVDFHGENKVSLYGTKDDFVFTTNHHKFSLRNVLSKVIDREVEITESPHEVKSVIKHNATTISEEITFIDVNIQAVYHSTVRRSLVKTLNSKYTAREYIKAITAEFGYDSLMFLLKKVDDKIISIEKNVDTKSVDIFISDGASIPISPENLSFGTIKLLEIISKSIPLFQNKGVMIIDEIENGLHLSLIKLIIEFYTNEDINIANSQFIMTTHNPLLFERGIIKPRNVYMREADAFTNIGNFKTKSRTEDMIKLVSSKNYFNDLFWIKNNQDPKSTLTNMNITRIINSFADSTTRSEV